MEQFLIFFKFTQNGEVIKDYPEEKPYPRKLILGYVELQPIHIVLSEHQDMNI